MTERIHYGSLEELDRQYDIQKPNQTTSNNNDINFVDLSVNEIDIDEEQQEVLREFERKRNARNIAVPTEDGRVRSKLQNLGEPQCFFGEGNAERRDRLRALLIERAEEGLEDIDDQSESEEEEEEEEFFTYGEPGLVESRRFLVEYSLPRAKDRLALQNAELELPIPLRKQIRHEWYTKLKTLSTISSQFGDDRPLSYCLISPNSKILATASFSGPIKLWNIPASDQIFTLKAHQDRVSGIDFHPDATLSQSPGSLNLVSSGVDGSVHGWSFENEMPIISFKGHEQRVARVSFHPSGRFLGTASFDQTWRLWDVETASELLLQEGHSREVFSIGFQGDGALCASGGKDSIGRVWDMRVGRSVMVLQGHVKSILSLDWSPNGHQLATGSEDHTIKIWDLRGKGSGCINTIPAHTNVVSQVKYFKAGSGFDISPATSNNDKGKMVDVGEDDEFSLKKHLLNGSYLVSSSYDGTCKVWTEGDWKSIKVLSGVDSKIMCCDVSQDGNYLATALYDRTFKLYSFD